MTSATAVIAHARSMAFAGKAVALALLVGLAGCSSVTDFASDMKPLPDTGRGSARREASSF